MSYQQAIANMSEEVFLNLKTAVETGKWPDGKTLSVEQKEHAMQAVIAYSQMHLSPEQQVGAIDKGHKEGDQCDDKPDTMTWIDG